MCSLDPENPVCAKLGDFGLAETASPSLQELLKTWQWLAPEVINAAYPNYDEKSDVFSYAMVVYEIFTRRLPYTEYSQFLNQRTQVLTDEQLKDQELLHKLTKFGWIIDEGKKIAVSEEWKEQKVKTAIIEGLRPTMDNTYPEKIRKLFLNCTQSDPNARPSIAEIASELSSGNVSELFQRNQHKSRREYNPPERDYIDLSQVLEKAQDKLGAAMAVSPLTGEIWAAGRTGNIYVVNYKDLTKSRRIETGTSRVNVIHPFSDVMWIGNDNGSIYIIPQKFSESVFDLKNKQPDDLKAGTPDKKKHTKGEKSVVMINEHAKQSPTPVRAFCDCVVGDKTLMFSGDVNGFIHVWNPTDLSHYYTTSVRSSVFSLCFVPKKDSEKDDSEEAGAKSFGTMWVGSMKDIFLLNVKEKLCTIKEHWQAHTGRIRSAVFVDDSVWTTSIDGITVWDASFTNPNPAPRPRLMGVSSNYGSPRSSLQFNNSAPPNGAAVPGGFSYTPRAGVTTPRSSVQIDNPTPALPTIPSETPLSPRARPPPSDLPPPLPQIPPTAKPRQSFRQSPIVLNSPPSPASTTSPGSTISSNSSSSNSLNSSAPSRASARISPLVSMYMFKPTTSRPCTQLSGHTGEVHRVIKVNVPAAKMPVRGDNLADFSQPSQQVWSCSFDSTILVWNSEGLKKHQCCHYLSGHKSSIDLLAEISPGLVCSAGQKDKSLHIWKYEHVVQEDEPKNRPRLSHSVTERLNKVAERAEREFEAMAKTLHIRNAKPTSPETKKTTSAPASPTVSSTGAGNSETESSSSSPPQSPKPSSTSSPSSPSLVHSVSASAISDKSKKIKISTKPIKLKPTRAASLMTLLSTNEENETTEKASETSTTKNSDQSVHEDVSADESVAAKSSENGPGEFNMMMSSDHETSSSSDDETENENEENNAEENSSGQGLDSSKNESYENAESNSSSDSEEDINF